jgi:hypothetical protein
MFEWKRVFAALPVWYGQFALDETPRQLDRIVRRWVYGEVYVAAAVRACLENDENFTNIMDR